MTDIERGREALSFFHNASLGFKDYQYAFDDFLALYGKKLDIYLDGIGMVIRENAVDGYKVKDAMEALAKQAQGRIPKDHQAYVYAIGNKAGQVSYLDLTKTVIRDVTLEVTEGVQSFGNQTITGLKWMNTLLPFLMVAGFAYFMFSLAPNKETVKRAATKATGAAKKAVAAAKKKMKKA